MMKKQLMKSKKRAILAGVCAGLGEYCNISPWVFRGLFLLPFVLRLVPGILSIIVYILLVAVLPGNRRIEDQDVVEVDYEIIDDDGEATDFSGEQTEPDKKVD